MPERDSNILVDILKLCLQIDEKAVDIYRHFWKTCKDESLRNFWEKKTAEEARHVVLWDKLGALAVKGDLPNIFDEPSKVKDELGAIVSNIGKLFKAVDCQDLTKSFLLALRMEFYTLHPAFSMLFRLVNDMQIEKLPEEHYEEHLGDFFEVIKHHKALSPELEFISETIRHLWQSNERLAIETNTDGLTKIFNRRGFFYMIKPVAHIAQRNHLGVAMIMIDIDDFKKVNDENGHRAGDRALIQVAQLIKTNTRRSDIVGRYGGEEFCIFMLSDGNEPTMKVADKIRKAVEVETKSSIPLTISAGVAIGFIEGEVEREVEKLIRRADENLYLAKRSGKNLVIVK